MLPSDPPIDESVAVLEDRHRAAAFALALSILGSRAHAEDATQDAFVSAWRSRHDYRPARGSVRAWILGITRHRALDQVRRRATYEVHHLHAEGAAERVQSAELTDSTVLEREQATELRDALARLPEEQRRVINLAYFSAMSQSEIAIELDLPLGTVKGRTRLGLDKLRLDFVAPHPDQKAAA